MKSYVAAIQTKVEYFTVSNYTFNWGTLKTSFTFRPSFIRLTILVTTASLACKLTLAVKWQLDTITITHNAVYSVLPPQREALLSRSYPTSSPTKLLFIADAKAGGLQELWPAYCFSAAPLRLRAEEGHSAFWFKLFCAMTALQGAATLKEHYTQPVCNHHIYWF